MAERVKTLQQIARQPASAEAGFAACIPAGAAIVDITPPAGMRMAGYAARLSPATGTHDKLTARAVAVADMAIVCVDVVGLHEETCCRIRQRSSLADDCVIVTALHTHGGPASVPGRGGAQADPAYVARIEDACVEAIETALRRRRPARLLFGNGIDPGVARNRRHPGGVTDPQLPVLAIRGVDGEWIAAVVSYACHPVVLGADNTLWTADYPGVVRTALEAACPGAVAVFLTGCAGDAGIGDTPHGSISTKASEIRSYANAERIGRSIGAAALAAPIHPLAGSARSASTSIELELVRQEEPRLDLLASEWRAKASASDPAWAALYESWSVWADTAAREPLSPSRLRVTVFDWGGVRLVALPGEVFAATARQIRTAIDGMPVGGRSFVFCFADGVPGYIPPHEEYAFGGYEVDEAHRYYGMPGAFVPGSAERLVAAAVTLAGPLTPANVPVHERA
jgi:neutral ceramidase